MPTTRSIVEDTLADQFDPEVFADRRTVVVVPDATRPVDYRAMVGPLLERLKAAGAEVTVLVGPGLHRPMSDSEIAPLRGVVDELDLSLRQHDADAQSLVELAPDVSRHVSSDSTDAERAGWPTLPARFNRHVTEAERLVSVGTVEPHQYAGFSGGPKGVAIGCASHATVSAMHGLEFLRDAGTRLGHTDANPFHRALWALIEPLAPLFGLQIVPGVHDDADSRPAAFFGAIDASFQQASTLAASRFFRTVETPYEWLHLPIASEKAVNFYQASRAATYVALSHRPAVADGGTLFLEAACPEGLGKGAGERACGRAMQRGREALLEELRSQADVDTEGGQQRAYVIALALDRCDIVLVGADPIPELRAMDIPQFDTLAQARRATTTGSRGTTIADVFHRIPVLAD